MKNKKPKIKKYSKLFKSFMFYKKHMKLLLSIIFVSLFGSGVSMLMPIFEGNIVTQFTEANFDKALIYGILTLAVGAVLEGTYMLWYQLLMKMNRKVKVDIKYQLINGLVDLETKNYDKTNSGVFISRVNKDANELSTFYNSFIDCIAEIISNFGFLIYIAFLNIWVMIFVVVEIVVVFLIENHRIKLLFKNRKKWKECDEKVVGSYSEIIRGVRDIKVLNLKQSAINAATKRQNEAIVLSYKLDTQNDCWRRFKNFVCVVFRFLLILMCILLIKYNLLLPATFFIVYLYIGKVRNLTNYVVTIKQNMAEGELAAERVFEVLENQVYTKENFGTKQLENINGQIEFKDVCFAYGEKEQLFNNLNLKIEANQTVGIVGKSGQGKSTILSLIDKLYEINSGTISIDGVAINELSEKSLRDNVSIVMQTPYIFNTTITENLELVKPDATKEEIYDACKRAQIHDFIMELPDNYESTVGENGVVLSGGQRQRLAIARALLKNSKIILFDEATSALDNESQGKIKLAIDDLSRDHTIVIVAHRLSTVVDCDKIFVLDGNTIVAEGTHQQLMKNCKIYQELYKIEEQ